MKAKRRGDGAGAAVGCVSFHAHNAAAAGEWIVGLKGCDMVLRGSMAGAAYPGSAFGWLFFHLSRQTSRHACVAEEPGGPTPVIVSLGTGVELRDGAMSVTRDGQNAAVVTPSV